MISDISTSCSEARMVGVRSRTTALLIAAGNEAWSCGNAARTLSTVCDDVRSGTPEDHDEHGRLAVGESSGAQVLDGIPHVGHLRELQRRAVLPGDDDGTILLCLVQLVVGVDLMDHVAVHQPPGRTTDVGGGEHLPDVLQPDAVPAERLRVELHAHRGQRAAADEHLPHALHPRQALLDDARRRVVHLTRAHGVGGEGVDDDGRVRGVHLAIGRIHRQRRRQVGARRVDGRLHVARGAVDVPVEVELEHDRGRAERARRRHLGDAGDASELALQRRRHRARHGLRARAGKACRYLDGGKVHLG